MAGKRINKKRLKRSTCPLCGKSLPLNPSLRVVGSSGQAVCTSCLYTAKRIAESAKAPVPPVPTENIVPPTELMRRLDQAIIGQQDAKLAISIALWKQQLRAKGCTLPNCSLLLYGPTGCGKTALVREAARIADLPFVCFDATSLTEAGYRGQDAKDMVADLIERFGVKRASYGVIFLDEVDKLAAVKGNEYRGVYSRGTQHSLLKLVEGHGLTINGDSFFTGNILYVFGGAFSALRAEKENIHIRRQIGFERVCEAPKTVSCFAHQDFVDFGMEPELMGRIGRCVPLQALTSTDMKQILLESSLSVYRIYQEFFRSHGQELVLDPSEIDALIQHAVEQKKGARGLNTLVEQWVEPKLLALSEEVSNVVRGSLHYSG